MKQITIQAPEGFEFDSDEPVPIQQGEWYFRWGKAVYRETGIDTFFEYYRLRKVYKAQEGDVVVFTHIRTGLQTVRFFVRDEGTKYVSLRYKGEDSPDRAEGYFCKGFWTMEVLSSAEED